MKADMIIREIYLGLLLRLLRDNTLKILIVETALRGLKWLYSHNLRHALSFLQ